MAGCFAALHSGAAPAAQLGACPLRALFAAIARARGGLWPRLGVWGRVEETKPPTQRGPPPPGAKAVQNLCLLHLEGDQGTELEARGRACCPCPPPRILPEASVLTPGCRLCWGLEHACLRGVSDRKGTEQKGAAGRPGRVCCWVGSVASGRWGLHTPGRKGSAKGSGGSAGGLMLRHVGPGAPPQ